MNAGPFAWQMQVVHIRRDVGLGPAINEFCGFRGQVHTAMTARAPIVVVPPRAMEGIARDRYQILTKYGLNWKTAEGEFYFVPCSRGFAPVGRCTPWLS